MTESLLTMAKELTLAQIQAGQVEADSMLSVLQSTYATLQQLQTAEESSQADASPAQVDWKKSITKHAVRCLECGASFKQLSTRHLRLHDMDGRSYREKYGIPRTQPLSTSDVLARRREIVQSIKPWEQSPSNQSTKKGAAAKTSSAKASSAKASAPKARSTAKKKAAKKAPAKKARRTSSA